MNAYLIRAVATEEKIAIAKWGRTDTTPGTLLAALLEETGEVAHAINHNESHDDVLQEIIEAIAILSQLYNMVSGV